jgi:hypothetical protein
MKKAKDYFNGHTELMVGTFAFLGYILFWIICKIFHIAPPPLAFLVKPVFGLFSATMIMTAVWFIFEKGYKAYKNLIDPDDIANDKKLTEWQKTILAYCFYALYAIIAAYSASQL